jgi:hypothetical protein
MAIEVNNAASAPRYPCPAFVVKMRSELLDLATLLGDSALGY